MIYLLVSVTPAGEARYRDYTLFWVMLQENQNKLRLFGTDGAKYGILDSVLFRVAGFKGWIQPEGELMYASVHINTKAKSHI